MWQKGAEEESSQLMVARSKEVDSDLLKASHVVNHVIYRLIWDILFQRLLEKKNLAFLKCNKSTRTTRISPKIQDYNHSIRITLRQ